MYNIHREIAEYSISAIYRLMSSKMEKGLPWKKSMP